MPGCLSLYRPRKPEQHLYAAKLMGVDVSNARPNDAGELLAGTITDLIYRTGMPNGLRAMGFAPDDVDLLVAGTLPQHRVTKLSLRPAEPEQLKKLFWTLSDV